MLMAVVSGRWSQSWQPTGRKRGVRCQQPSLVHPGDGQPRSMPARGYNEPINEETYLAPAA